MNDKILFNGRYGAVEIDKSGIITRYNENALKLLSGHDNADSLDKPEKVNIAEYAAGDKYITYDSARPEIVFSMIEGVKLIDVIYYEKTETVLVRFSSENPAFIPFFDIVKFSSSLFLELDNDLNILFASESFFKMAGYNKSEICGSAISLFTDKTNFTKISSASGLCQKNVLDCIKVEDVQFSFNNIHRLFDLEVYPVSDNYKQFSGILIHLLDTSCEKKCRQMNRSIRRMSAVANFAGGIAHDYNNALTAVLGNISLAKMDAEKDSELEELLHDAESAGLKIKTLTERLGLYSRGMKPARVKTDVKALIENIVSEVFPGFKGSCNTSIQENMFQPDIDPELISEAIMHVFENAIDAADQPAGEVLIEVMETEISKESVFRETSLVPGKYIQISVRDNGPGFDEHTLNEIFDPYITTKPGREGLGLALTYTILKRHRGFISADTSDTGGAEFKIYIPLF